MEIEDLQIIMQEAFRVEAADLLAELDSSMLDLETHPQDVDLLNRVFRAIHTIKGSGATAGFNEMAAFTHHFEELFEEARMARLTITPEIIDLALQAKDIIGQLLEPDSYAALAPTCTKIVENLALFLPLKNGSGLNARTIQKEEGPKKQRHTIFFKPNLTVFLSGTDPVSLVDELRALGEATVSVLIDEVPLLENLNPKQCHLAWEVVLVSARPIDEIKEVFLFVESESEIRIESRLELRSGKDISMEAFLDIAGQSMEALSGFMSQLRGTQEPDVACCKNYLRILKTFHSAASLEGEEKSGILLAEQILIIEVALTSQGALSDQAKATLAEGNQKLSDLISDLRGTNPLEGTPESPVAQAPTAEPSQKATVQGASTIRVDQEKLDRLMRSVGELLVARNALPILAKRLALEHGLSAMSKEVKDAGTHISHIADDLQAALMSIRMMPIRSVFQRFPRMVRDICRTQSKEAELLLEGEETELDKTVIEQIADPLVHLVRNAADHGIESPEVREQAGKPRVGKVVLKAYNKEHNVIIEVHDDGRGMSPDRLKLKALEKGLITSAAAEAMDNQSALELIFLPGFTTADKVTDISGRGVGMDVVRSNIRQLQGTIHLESSEGGGSHITIKLPASLMVSKGILVEAGGEEYVFPIESVMQTVRLPSELIHRHADAHFVTFRNEVYPVLRLVDHFVASRQSTEIVWPQEVAIAIVQTNRGSVGVAVDRFLGDVEVIVKPMGRDFENIKAFQGATIMGNGRIALVINPSGFV